MSLSYSMDRIGISNSMHISLRVQILPQLLPWRWTWNRPLEWEQRCQVVLVAHRKDSPETFILESFTDLARRFSFNFYELDPRIGVAISSPLLSSPLFDPMDVERDPLFCSNLHRSILEWESYSSQSYSHPLISEPSTKCIFCTESVLRYSKPEEVHWGGGNLGWVHRACAPWVTESLEIPCIRE